MSWPRDERLRVAVHVALVLSILFVASWGLASDWLPNPMVEASEFNMALEDASADPCAPDCGALAVVWAVSIAVLVAGLPASLVVYSALEKWRGYRDE